MTVSLTESELHDAIWIGCIRNTNAVADGRWSGPIPKNHLSSHTIGAAGEMAFLKAMGWPMELTVDTYRSASDVKGKEIEVRTRRRHDWELQIRKDDRDGIFVLVTCDTMNEVVPKSFRVHGWITKEEGMKVGRWEDLGGYGKPCWLVSQNKLKPMEDLKDEDCKE